MNTLVIDRSTSTTSSILVDCDGEIRDFDLGIWDTAPAAKPPLQTFDRIVVGAGPGSFAGIRSALAFAQGYALGSKCEVMGIVSPAAFAEEGKPVAVVGDARRGMFWIALFDGFTMATKIFQVERELLGKRIPMGIKVVSPDHKRIDGILKEEFGERYSPAPAIDARNLVRAFSANPDLLFPEPLPIYLNPAVRD